MSIAHELYPDFKTVMHGDVEVPLALRASLQPLAPITADEVLAFTAPSSPQTPRPTVTAWDGADLDAYFMAPDGLWKHCQSGAVWSGIKCLALFVPFMAVLLSCAVQLRLDAWPWELLA